MSSADFYGHYPSNSNPNLEYVDVEDTLPDVGNAVPDVHRPGTHYDDRPLPQPPLDYVDAAGPFAQPDRRASPIAELRSLASIGGNPIDERTGDVDPGGRSLRSYRSDHRRSRDYLKLLLKEDLDGKKMRRMLNAALDRAEAEGRRAQEAERRALEIAGRFREELDGRLAAEREVAQVKEELRLYKLRLNSAQGEITRASELLEDVRAERDDAEAAAVRAREKARQFREQHLVTLAREEGRRQGYKEGVKIGFEEAAGGYATRSGDHGPSRTRSLQDLLYDTVPPSGIDVQDVTDRLPTVRSPPRADTGFAPSSASPADGGYQPAGPSTVNIGAGAEGSRFREIMSPAASTLESLASGRPSGPIPPPGETPKHIGRRLPSQARPYRIAPSDTQSGTFSMTAPDRPGRASRDYYDHSQPVIRDYAFQGKTRSSPQSVADSLPSTAMSQYDILNPLYGADRTGALHTIPEVSTSMEMSPAEASQRASNLMPDPVAFPAPSNGTGDGVEDTDPRYSQPAAVDEWRRSLADEVNRSNAASPNRPPSRQNVAESMRSMTPSVTGSRPYYAPADAASMSQGPQQTRYETNSIGGRRSGRSSNEVTIMVQSPSNPTSEYSLVHQISGMLSPSASQQILSQPQPVIAQYGRPPSRPASRSDRAPSAAPVMFTPSAPLSDFPLAQRQASPKLAQNAWTNVHLDPRRTPSPVEGHPPVHARPPRAYGKSVSSNNPLQPRTLSVRPPSANGHQNGPPLEYVDAYTPPGGPSQQPYYRNPGRSSPAMSARSSTSRVPNGHHRSVSMGGGVTPTSIQAVGKKIRRVPSTGSISSARSGQSDYKPYDSSTYVDPAYYASRDNLAMNPNMVPNGKFGGASPALSSRSLRN